MSIANTQTGAESLQALYIHGFNSAGFGGKNDALRAELGAGNVVNPTLPTSPAAAMQVLDWLVSRLNAPNFFVLGSSLGGFYALNLALHHPVNVVLVNPALINVAPGLAYAKEEQTNFKTGEKYAYTDQDLKELEALEISDWTAFKGRVFAYLDADDEVLPAPKSAEFLKSKGFHVRLFEGGDHLFQHMDELFVDLNKQLTER